VTATRLLAPFDLWMLFGWVLVRPDVDSRPENAVAASLYDLANRLGKVGTAVAVSVAAYLIGAVSQELTNGIPRLWREVRAWKVLAPIARTRFGARLLGRLEPEFPPGLSSVRRTYEDALEALDRESLDESYDAVRDELEEERTRAAEGAMRELELPATLLVGQQPELFAEVDRLRAEGELRLAVALPLAALAIALTSVASPIWLLMLPATVVLAVQGNKRAADSRGLIADALSSGRIESSSVGRFQRWANDLDKVIDRAIKAREEETEQDEKYRLELPRAEERAQ
jgi:hypothetical protein